MSQVDTYRPAVLPSEAVMMPAVEDIPDAPPPAAQETVFENDPAMVPARTRNASVSLERMRNRMRVMPQGMQWMDASKTPLDRSTPRQEPPRPTSARPAQETPVPPRNRTITNGSALSTLMRSAARQHMPAPTLASPPRQVQQQSAQQGPGPAYPAGHPQMRGALRRVVRNAQQMPTMSTMMGPVQQ